MAEELDVVAEKADDGGVLEKPGFVAFAAGDVRGFVEEVAVGVVGSRCGGVGGTGEDGEEGGPRVECLVVGGRCIPCIPCGWSRVCHGYF